MELRPVEATYHGLHEHDRRWPDGTLAGAEELRDLVRRFESDLEGIGGGLDADLARYVARLMRFQLEDMRLWARMPEATEQIGTGIFLLFARENAPLEERLETIAGRLEGVPSYLAASRERLTDPVRLWCEVGIESARQLPELFSTVVAAAPRGPLHDRLERAAGTASEAAEAFARWLEGNALARASDAWALGEGRFERLVGLRELPDGAGAIRELGRRYLAEVVDEREQLISSCWPGRSVEEVLFVQLNDLVWRACRVIIDVELSSGRMTFEQGVEMLVGQAAMGRSGAEAELRRYTYTPGYQLSYLYGKHLLLQLRQRRRRIEGDAFDLRAFHDRLLSAGALPAATWDALF